ncbi:hypothetical protein [Kribbella sp. NPDC006257]|uniref:hypothetical protein n=1 Tax=Kribbella sp. NPDC006257 TaxID=3156738 RepID=UPI0033AB2D0B
MKRTNFRAVIVAIAAVFSLAAAIPAMAQAQPGPPVKHAPMAQAQPGPPSKHAATIRPNDCIGNVNGLFLDRWNQNTSQGINPFGCSTSDVFAYAGGTYQWFANGSMAWSPRQSGDQQRMVTSVYSSGGNATFQFGSSLGYNYDAWLLTIESWDGQQTHNIGRDQECGEHVGGVLFCGRDWGFAGWNGLPPGEYKITVEGCDISWTGSHDCKQGFTVPVWFWV